MSQFYGTLLMQNDIFGWSENYWLLGPDAGSAEAQLQTISDASMSLRANDVFLIAARIVDKTVPRKSFFPDLTVGPWKQTGTYSTPAMKSISPNLAMLVRLLSDDDLTRSRIFLRSIPSDELPAGFGGPEVKFTLIPAWSTLLDAYRTAVEANAVMVKKGAGRTYSQVIIDTVSPSTQAHLRRAGRPFGLPAGRRRIA